MYLSKTCYEETFFFQNGMSEGKGEKIELKLAQRKKNFWFNLHTFRDMPKNVKKLAFQL